MRSSGSGAQTDENHQRLVRVRLDTRARAIRLIPQATWGDEQVRIFGFEPVRHHRDKIPTVPDGPHFSRVRRQADPADLAPPAKYDQPGNRSLHSA